MSYLLQDARPIIEDALTRTAEAVSEEGLRRDHAGPMRDSERKTDVHFWPTQSRNLALAFDAIKLEKKVCTMLPCNLIVFRNSDLAT